MCYQLDGVFISEGLGGVYIRRNIQTCDIIRQSEGGYISKLRVRIFENVRLCKREQLATDVEGHRFGGQSCHLVILVGGVSECMGKGGVLMAGYVVTL